MYGRLVRNLKGLRRAIRHFLPALSIHVDIQFHVYYLEK